MAYLTGSYHAGLVLLSVFVAMMTASTTAGWPCMYPDDGVHLRDLMSNADSAMYYAKKMGRGNYQFFTPEMNAAAGAATVTALRRGA